MDKRIFVPGDNPMYSVRKESDRLIEIPFTGKSDSTVYEAMRFVLKRQVKNSILWDTFIEQFEQKSDSEGGWRGEFWGKMMRGACYIYRLTLDEELYEILRDAVIRLMDTAEDDGRISTYKREKEFFDWDMWCRKYVLLGLEYFYDICGEKDLKEKIVSAAVRHLDCIIEHIGKEDGKVDILETSNYWGGMNSSSILEPVVKLYFLTKNKKYLDFAEYIVSTGGCSDGNVFECALKNEIPPCKYPEVKAYETMSFFEGVAELYTATHREEYLKAVVNFTDAVLETDYTIIGSSGCTHELFDNSSVKQIIESQGIMQETCVSVTLSKLLFRAFCLTGDPKYADAIENTFYNAILGSINFGNNTFLDADVVAGFMEDYKWSAEFTKKIGGFMFDSYAPLYKSSRNRQTGGYMRLPGHKSYGCCAAIGSLGTAILPLSAALLSDDGKSLYISQYISGEFRYYLPDGAEAEIKIKTGYPYTGEADIEVRFTCGTKVERIALRIPSYGDAKVSADGKEHICKAGEYVYFDIKKAGEENKIKITFDTDAKVTLLENRAAVKKGPVVLAADCRNADIDTLISKKITADEKTESPFVSRLSRKIRFDNGNDITLVDFASAGSDWARKDRKITVWFDTSE